MKRRQLAALPPWLWTSSPWSAHAGCDRPLRVPVAPAGFSVRFDGETVRGIYPDWLRLLEAPSGCRMAFETVPRARLNRMFELGQADLMIPAARTPERDAVGLFVPLLRTRPAFLSLRQRELPPLTSLGVLLARRELRVAVVRGHEYDARYRQAVEVFHRQGRLVQEPDAASVARALQQGLADLTILLPTTFYGTLMVDEARRSDVELFRVHQVEEFDWIALGAYLSRQRFGKAELARLTSLMQAAKPQLWQSFQAHYPLRMLEGNAQMHR